MASLTQSEFRAQERADGGPFIWLDEGISEEGKQEVYVFFSDVPQERAGDKFACILTVQTDLIYIYPVGVRPDKPDYLKPRYGTLERILLTRKVARPFQLPKAAEDVESLLDDLPPGFLKNYRFGLGFQWEYRSLTNTLQQAPEVNTLVIHGGDGFPELLPTSFVLTLNEFKYLCAEVRRIAGRATRSASREKGQLMHNMLLHRLDPERFPKSKREIKSGDIAELRGDLRNPVALSKYDRRAVLSMLSANVSQLASTEPHSLMQLKGDIELVTLGQLIERYSEMLTKEYSESKWQGFFEDNPFILSLAFSVPFMLVQSQPYAGGRRSYGGGGKHPDFIYAAAATGNLAVIEIKKPSTVLLQAKAYRGDDIFGLSSELSGAVSQVLNQRETLQRTLPVLKSESKDLLDKYGFSTRCIVVAGRSPTEIAHQKSFELMRNSMVDVVVMTFDELLERLRMIQVALTPPTLKASGPFDTPF